MEFYLGCSGWNYGDIPETGGCLDIFYPTKDITKSPNFKLAIKDTPFCNILSDSMSILQKTKGEIYNYFYCKACNTKHQTPFQSYKSIDVNDIFHLLVAKENNCEKFITFDSSFNLLKYYDKIKPVEITVN